MAKLACKGGKPVTSSLVGNRRLSRRTDLERKYLLQAYDSGVWDDWTGSRKSMASRFEEEWAKFSNSEYCALLTNGTHSLQVALEALDVGFGDEVIVPGLTWQATASVVCDVNAVPILVDIDPETLCIDTNKIEEAITSRTRAIMPVHLYHRMADMDRILEIARKHNLHVIEDCAHTHGSRWNDQGAGTLGDLGAFSFQSSKLMNSGEGGAVLTQEEELYWKVVSQRASGREYKGIKVHNGNYRITGFQAAVLLGQLSAMRRNAPVIDRRGLALDKAVADAPGTRPLRRHPCITRQCSYVFAFLYDKEAFDGLDADVFRRTLSAEIGQGFGGGGEPLNNSGVYYPQTKKRHHLSKEYVKAITPSRWELPAAEKAQSEGAVTTGWGIFACPPARAKLLTDAIVKIYDNRDELLEH